MKDILVCLAVKKSPMPPLATATQDVCELCQESIWVSPASRKIAVERSCQMLCINCALQQTQQDQDFEVMPLSKEQINEVKSSINPERN